MRIPTTVRLSLCTVAAVVLVCALGPLFAPHTATETVAAPYSGPASGHLLGTDHLGRDVLARVLLGGFPVLIVTTISAALCTLVGATAGVAAAILGARHRLLEGAALRPLDAIAAVPPVLTLMLVTTALPAIAGIIVAVVVAGTHLAARIAFAAARPLIARPHVELAVARGESLSWLLWRELAPLAAAPILADAGLRLILALYLVTAAGFLGVGVSGTDWGTLIVEAIPGAMSQPLALLAPLGMVAVMSISVNLASDALVRRSRTVLG